MTLGPRYDAAATAPRVLCIVARDRPDLYESLRATFVESSRLAIVLDRRTGAVHRGSESTAERRRLAVDQLLRTRGWARVRIEADGRVVLGEITRAYPGGARSWQ